MRLFEAIIDANHRAMRGDATAGLRPAEYADSLPIAALSCIDARLNPLLPEVLGIDERDFIWLRNSGNIIFDTMSSMMRTIALACAIKGAREIAVIGHTDCLVCKTNMMQLTERFRALGIDRSRLPENLNEFFGLFASERQNVIKACDFIRQSPLIGPKIPVHGLVVDIETGKLEWIVNGYQVFATMSSPQENITTKLEDLKLPEFQIGEMKFPETKIGDLASATTQVLEQAQAMVEQKILEKTASIAHRVKDEFRIKLKAPKAGEAPPPIPLPPPIMSKPQLPRDKKDR
jgi:carbonic anhydrase